MKKIADNRDIKSLTTIQHILLRPGMYIGGTSPSESEVWVLNDDGTISYRKVRYVEGLLKTVNEAIDNSVDEGLKTDWKYANKISVTITKDTCSIEDNGRGIPVKKNEAGEWMCVNAVCKPMSGSNFEDDKNRGTIGLNGVGIKGTNIFSTSFECVTCDGQGKMRIRCANNLSSIDIKELTPTTKTGTQITFTPDFKRFSTKCFDDNIIMMVKTRLKFLSWFFPKCSISFNGEKINIKAKELSSMFPQPSIVLNAPNVYLCVYPSEEPYVLSYVNGISLKEGGTHVDYIANKVIGDIRDKVSKKYKSIKPADIRNRIGVVIFFNNFPNCTFDSQTKEKLTNAWSEISAFLTDNDINLDNFTNKILNEKEIISNITELFRLKEELAEQKELAKLNKSKKEVSSEKYFPPIGNTDKKYLMITEGFSAFSGISPILGRKGIGYYMLKGKIKNVLEEKPSSYMKNQEIQELVQILGINIGGETLDMNYEKAVILSDQDSDGVAIAGLIITLFSTIAPQMLKDGRICRLNTPLLIGKKNNKVVEWYYEIPEKSKMKKGVDYFYMKGLGSNEKSDLSYIIEQEGGLEKMFLPFEVDKDATKSISNWYGKDSEPRKNFLRGREFHIDKI